MVTSTKQRRSKVVTLEEAAAQVKDGMKLGMGGGHSRESPNAFSRELVRRGVKNLTIIPTNATAYQTDILLGAGCVKTLYLSYCGMDYIGAAPNFRRLAEAGKLDIIEFDEMGLLRGLKASVAGVRFFPLPDGMQAVDVVRANPAFYKIIDDPFTGEKVVVVPPISPDIAVIHVPKCDMYGNAREMGMVEDILHQSAKRLIITAEEIVPLEDTQANFTDVTISGRFVDFVVEVPFGAHPGPCSGVYPLDEEGLREYQKAGKSEETFKQYLDKYVYGCKNHAEYLEKIGIAKKILKLKYY